MLWTVANMSTAGVPHVPKILFTISRWRLLSVVIGDLVEIDAPLSCSDSPEYVWSLWLCLEFVAIGTDPLLDVTGCGNGFHPVR